jgi:hypothetical protein
LYDNALFLRLVPSASFLFSFEFSSFLFLRLDPLGSRRYNFGNLCLDDIVLINLTLGDHLQRLLFLKPLEHTGLAALKQMHRVVKFQFLPSAVTEPLVVLWGPVTSELVEIVGDRGFLGLSQFADLEQDVCYIGDHLLPGYA